MRDLFAPEQRRDLARRGFSRRDFARLGMLLAAGQALPFANEQSLAQGLAVIKLPPGGVRINANENPMGPCPEAVEAATKMVIQGGRYLFEETSGFVEAMAAAEGLSPENVLPAPGSSDLLHRAVLAFTGPSKSFVVADPGYEAGERPARFVGAKVHRVPLRKDGSHDPAAMAGVDPQAGLIYVCNPNNPTGSVTRKEDVESIVANKPKGCVVLLDEAYIHLSSTAEPGSPMVTAGRDVIVLRTFSKLYGMAGLRAGAALARPDLIETLRAYGTGIMPTTGMAAATASLKVKGLAPRRREAIAATRGETAAWLKGKGFDTLPSEANMLMVDTRRPGRQVITAMVGEGVAIGRTWPSMPNHVRVSIGTPDEMARFRDAFAKVMHA